MSGILFLRTNKRKEITDFYTTHVDCDIWLEQAECTILRHGNFLFGFCERDTPPQTEVMLTFFYDSQAEVDQVYARHKATAEAPPKYNEKYRIYQFFAHDPEGRALEFQQFTHPIAEFRSGDDLLLTRRSIREFTADPVSDGLIDRIIESCRYAPTAWNYQPHYYRVVRDPDDIRFLGGIREDATEPIGRASVAVAICVDAGVSPQPKVDGAIAAYHFMLAAWFHGLGTCWMGDMDQAEIKARLGIPGEHYLATVTPLGRPRDPGVAPPDRKPLSAFIRR